MLPQKALISMSENIPNVIVSIRAAALVASVNSKATNNEASIWKLVCFAPSTNRTGIPRKC